MTINATQFLALGTAKRTTITVEGAELTVRELSVADRSAVLALRETDPSGVPALVVRLCAINPDGTPMFTSAQDAAIAALRPAIVDAVASAVMRLGGMMTDEADEKKG